MNDVTPWYKQFWPWFIMVFPATAVVAGIATVIIALDGQSDMVIDDYYKEGKAINQNLSKQKRALELGVRLDFSLVNQKITLTFDNQDKFNLPAVRVSFYHPTLAKYDFQTLLTKDALGNYTALLQNEIKGQWDITVSPLNEEWKLKQRMAFPNSSTVKFIAK